METTQKNKAYFFKQHLVDMMRWESNPAPWPRMLLCAMATCIPLVVGLMTDQLVVSIYGALMGYILGLSDHPGRLGHRLWAVTLTFLLMVAGFAVGQLLHDLMPVYLILLAALVYWLGILAGEGAELEKTLLFTTIALVSAHSGPPLPSAIVPLLWLYAGIGYACMMLGILLMATVKKPVPEPIIGFRAGLKKTLTLRKENHLHAASYAIMTLLSIALSHFFSLERGYWVTITVLLVMKPDKNPVFYRAFQRLAGTLLAVLCVDVLLQVVIDQFWLILLIIGCALGVPWAIKKNYWLVSFLATIMVVLLLDLVAPKPGDLHTPFVRLTATLLGCALGLAGMGLSRLGDGSARDGKDELMG